MRKSQPAKMKDQDVSNQSADEAASRSPDDVEIKTGEAAVSNSDVHQSIIHSMNQVPKFSEEWFKLKEQEISLRIRLAGELDEEEASEKVDKVDNVEATNLLDSDDELDSGSNKKVEAIADEAAKSHWSL
jgi:hypothetical protein